MPQRCDAVSSRSNTAHVQRLGAFGVESIGAFCALVGMVGILLASFATHLSFSNADPPVRAEDVHRYWIGVEVFAAGSTTSLVASVMRKARRTPWLHFAIATTGVAVAILFAVTEVGPVRPAEAPQPTPAPWRSGACLSGGDNSECPPGG